MVNETVETRPHLFSIWRGIQQTLLPDLAEQLGPMTEQQRLFASVAELVQVDKHLTPYRWVGNGRKPHDRKAIALAFIAKALWNFTETKQIIDYLKESSVVRGICGWDSAKQIPSESVFSRAFRDFSKGNLPTLIHEAMVQLYLGDKLIGHVSRDSTAIHARERPARKPRTATTRKKKPKEKAKQAGRKEPKEHSPKRIEMQVCRTLEENLLELPRKCDVGAKKNSKGHMSWWVGYKLHIDTVDGDIPVSAVLTSASLHDSQAAVPLIQWTTKQVTYLYELADSAYDAEQLKAFSCALGHVPIIDPNKRRGEPVELDPAQKVRYRERSAAERVNSNLKDNYGGRMIRVRGPEKVMAHLGFSIVALCAVQLLRRCPLTQ